MQKEIHEHPLLETLRQQDEKIRWTPKRQLHLTLQFLADISESQLSGIRTRLAHWHAPILRLQAKGLGCFPERGQPRILWAGLGGDRGPLLECASALAQHLQALDIPIETRTFHPHLTLGRIQAGATRSLRRKLQALSTDFRSAEFQVRNLVLVQTQPGPQGSTYRILDEFPFSDSSSPASSKHT